MSKQVNIFVDGSCLGNPGPGGYGIILCYKEYRKIFSAGYILTTNNRMELMAAIVALEKLTTSCEVVLTTDSQYVRQGITQWIHNWKKYNWKNMKKKSVKNIDLWKRLEMITKIHKLRWEWIKGHSKHPENEFCDQLARKAAANPFLMDINHLD